MCSIANTIGSQMKESLGDDPMRDIAIPQWVVWLSKAATLSGKAPLLVAIAIICTAVKIGRVSNVMLAPTVMRRHSISRQSAYRGLASLEAAGLVTVRRCKGRSPLVSLIMPTPTAAEKNSLTHTC